MLTMEDHASKVLDRAKRDLNGIGKSMQNWGAGLTAGVTVPVIAAGAAVVKMASDQQEAINAVNEVYGSAADQVMAYGDTAAQTMGLAKAEYLSAAAIFGVYSDAAGLAGEDAAKFANDNLQLAADLGSFYNASTADVQQALQAAYRGEFDALDRYGIMLNQATLEQFALTEGIWDGNGAMTNQQRILATNAYMQSRAGAAAGDFARTSNSLANSQKILRAQIKDVGAQLGTVLLPTVTRVVAVFRDLLTRFQGLPESWQRWIVIIGLAVAAIGPLLLVLGTFLVLLPAIGAALTLMLGPLGLVIAAIALLTAAYIGNWWGFRDAVDGVAAAVAGAVSALWEVDAVRTTVLSAINAIQGVFDRVTSSISKFGTALLSGDWRRALEAIGDFLAAPAKAIGEFISGIETGFAPLDGLLSSVGALFNDFGRLIQEIFQGDFSGAIDVFQRLIGRIPEIVTGAFGMIPWADIGTAIVTAIEGLPALITDVTATLKQVGIDLLVGVLAGLNEYMPTITTWLGLVGEIAVAAVGDVTATLYTKGKQLLGGVISGFNAMLEPFNLAFSSVPIAAAAAVGDVTATLVDKGKDLIKGLMSGFAAQWSVMYTSLSGLGNAIIRAVGSLSSTLWSAGWNLIEGLIQGILSRIPYLEEVAGRVAGIVGRIISAYNLITSPSKYMMELGGYMAEGLAIGMERGIPKIESASRAMAAAGNVGVGFDGFQSYGNSSYQNNYGTIINEAPRYPADAIDSYSISRSRG